MIPTIVLKFRNIPASFYLLIGRIFLGLGQLLMIRVLTSVLDSGEIGKYYLLMSVVSGIAFFAISPVISYIQRHLHGWNKKGVARIAVRKILIYLAVVGTGASGTLYLLANFISIDLNVSMKIIVILIPTLVCVNALAGLFPDLCNLLLKYKAFVVLSNLGLWGKLGLICLFVSVFPHLVETVLFAMVCWGGLSAVVSGGYLYSVLKKPQNDDNPFNLKMLKEVFLFSGPLALAVGLYWGQSEGYRFVLKNIAGVDIVGKFVIAYTLGSVLMIAIDGIFHQIYLPIFYKKISDETDETHIAAWNKYAENLAGVFIPVGLYVAFAGPFLAHWLVHENYHSLGIYAVLGAISQLFRIFSVSCYFGIIARKNTGLLILPSLLGVIVALAGTFVLSPKFPMLGTGISLISANFIVSVGFYFQLKRKLAVKMPWPRIGEAILLSLPLGFILLIAHKLGWDILTITNLLLLALTGVGMLYIQLRLSKDLWMQREGKIDFLKV